MEEELVEILTKKQYKITTAESCTGGLVAATIVNVSGASEVFQAGFVTYANEAKEKELGVKSETLQTYGAVSEKTAKEMAIGCAAHAKAQVGISTTGIAGPGGGTAEKPVGLVYIGCAVRSNVYVEKNVFSGDRQQVRRQAADRAIGFALECIKKESV
ncbi:competence/damage-inducible protein CinA domain protein [Clostridium sp. CAG:167]|jgi:PncC family amidohydrolase|nr:competence/damage-inducible protein CinA domain protein [Clostridium sp. CAG:167]